MKLQERARELDRRYVPLLAQWTHRVRTHVAVRRGQLTSNGRQLIATSPAELDQRFAEHRLVKLVREIPQLGFVIIAAVFLAGTATALARHQATPSAVAGRPDLQERVPAAGTRLGPDIGETTSGYESTARRDLEQVAGSTPTSTRLALVSFTGYQTPAQISAVLGSLHVRRIYLRAPVGGAEALQLPYDIHGELSPSLRKAYADVALSRLAVRQSYLAYVATTQDDKAYHDDYAALAASTGREVIAYQHSCACVFDAVVEASARDLLALRGRQGVRSVQVAGKDVSLAQLVVQPLLPETNGLVTKGPATGAP